MSRSLKFYIPTLPLTYSRKYWTNRSRVQKDVNLAFCFPVT